MPYPSLRILAVTAALASLLAGCGSAPTALASLSSLDQTSSLGSSGAKRLLYISTTADHTTHGLILVYPANIHNINPQPIRSFYADRPMGLWVDNAGVLYVVNTFNNGPCSVAEYKPGASSPFLTITNGLGDAATVAVDAHGNVFVNTRDLNTLADVVVVYAPGATRPTRKIELPISGYDLGPEGMAFDSAGDLFVGAFLPQTAALHVFRIRAGGTHARDLDLKDVPGGGSGFSGVAVDPSGNLYVAGLSGIGVYAPGAHTPFRQISSGGGFIAIDGTNGVLYSGNAEYAPGGDTPVNTVQLPYATNTIGDAVGPSGM